MALWLPFSYETYQKGQSLLEISYSQFEYYLLTQTPKQIDEYVGKTAAISWFKIPWPNGKNVLGCLYFYRNWYQEQVALLKSSEHIISKEFNVRERAVLLEAAEERSRLIEDYIRQLRKLDIGGLYYCHADVNGVTPQQIAAKSITTWERNRDRVQGIYTVEPPSLTFFMCTIKEARKDYLRQYKPQGRRVSLQFIDSLKNDRREKSVTLRTRVGQR
ncbi:MAG: hypothetical protein CMF48_01275 [Legionellales bacterium]|nr:hypothetical protein [Legionellales bacterium]|tara:strand:+ start:318 stop:968 length:651 start_codon:yes stop_codon:yes gene_type:complete